MNRQTLVWVLSIVFASARIFAAPQVIGQWPATPQGAVQELALQGKLLYAKMTQGVAVFDSSDPARLRRISTLGDNSTSVTVTGPYLREAGFTEQGLEKMRFLDMQTPADPTVLYSRVGFGKELPAGAAQWPYVYRWSEQPNVLQVYDFTDPRTPVLKSEIPSSVYVPLLAQGNVLVALDIQGPIRFWDISNRTNPVPRGTYARSGPQFPVGLRMEGTRAYITDWTGLVILDFSNLDTPTELGRWNPPVFPPQPPMGFEVADGIALAGVANAAVFVIDLRNPANPTVLSQIPGLGSSGFARRGSTWFLQEYDKISAYDLTDPAHPNKLGETLVSRFITDVRIKGNYAFAHFIGETLDILDIQRPDQPSPVGEPLRKISAYDIEGDFLYAVTSDWGLSVYDISNPKAPSLKGRLPIPRSQLPPAVVARNNRVYIGGDNSIAIVNALVIETNLPVSGSVRALQLNGGFLYATISSGDQAGLIVIDLAQPSQVRKVTGALATYSIVLSGSAMYLPAQPDWPTTAEFSMWDVSDPGNPISKGKNGFPVIPNYAHWLSLGSDGKLYAAGDTTGNTSNPYLSGKVLAIDISSPFAPQIAGQLADLPNSPNGVQLRDGIAYIGGGGAGVIVAQFSGTSPERPTLEIHPEGQTHRVRWLKSFSDYQLFGGPTLDGPWEIETLGSSPTRLFNETTRPNRPGSRFYSLQKN